MSFRLVPKSVTLNDLERRNGVILRYFSEFGWLPGALRKSSRLLSHLLMSSCSLILASESHHNGAMPLASAVCWEMNEGLCCWWMFCPSWHRCFEFSSVLWHCWFSDRKDIWPIRNLGHLPPKVLFPNNNSYYYYIRLTAFFSRTTRVSRHQKGEPFWILLEQEMMGWQWQQLDHMQIICTSLQTDNHASTSPVGKSSGRKPRGNQPTQVHLESSC